MHQVERLGPGSIATIEFELTRLRASRLFLVTGRASYAASGAEQALETALARRSAVRFSDFSANPDVEEVRRGVESFRRFEPDVVLAVGGGSVIDMAKLVDFFGSTGFDPLHYLDGPSEPSAGIRPLIAVPTTAGSGSQATHFAVMYVRGKKHSVAHSSVLPAVAVVDPVLTASQPPYLTACAGMDALSQSVESHWSIHSTEESKQLATQALRRLIPGLPEAVRRPDPSNREATALGAHLAGKAINLTKTTAPHALSYPLTSRFGIPHGHAVGLSLSSFLRFNSAVEESDVLDSRGASYVRKNLTDLAGLFGTRNVEAAATRIDELLGSIGLETRLSALGVEPATDIDTILDAAFDPSRVANNPRRVTREALREILVGMG